jgi:hypothetical protein
MIRIVRLHFSKVIPAILENLRWGYLGIPRVESIAPGIQQPV